MTLLDFMTLVSAGFYVINDKSGKLIFTFLIGIDDINNVSDLFLGSEVLKAYVKYDKITIYVDIEL